MIDIQPYLIKLDKLREYMEYFTLWNSYSVWMDLQVCPDDFYIKQNLPLPKPYEKTIIPISFDEWYLKYQIEIDVAEMNKVKSKEQLPIVITDHAFERAKERIGLSHSALTTKAVKAYNEGISHKETAGNLKKYLDKIFLDEKKVNNSKILGEYIFLFRNNILITVYHVPTNLKKSVHKIQKQKTP